jgi:hypothetical protein
MSESGENDVKTLNPLPGLENFSIANELYYIYINKLIKIIIFSNVIPERYQFKSCIRNDDLWYNVLWVVVTATM